MRTIIEELNELEKRFHWLDNLHQERFHWLDNLHQERFHFITKDEDLFKKVIGFMDIYK